MKKFLAVFMALLIIIAAVTCVSATENEVKTFESVVYSGEQYATVSWDKVEGAEIYKLYITSETGYDDVSETTTETSYKWAPFNASPDKPYDIKVYAYDAQGVLIAKSVDLQAYVNIIMFDYWGTYGDVDFDGDPTIIDATLIMQNCAEMVEFGRAEKFVSDVDGEGDVTILDATIIQYFCAGISLDNENIRVNQPFFFGGVEFEIINTQPEEF